MPKDCHKGYKYQLYMKTLFICSANKQRSKTAEAYFARKHPEYNFKSAGTNIKICRKEGTTELTEDLLQWADKVYVMEKKHLEHYQNENIFSLKVPKQGF